MIGKIWSAWFDSPHKVMFDVLVVLVATVGWALSRQVAAGTVSEPCIHAFEVVCERATYIAGVIALAARGGDMLRGLGEGLRGATGGTPPAPAQ